MNPQRRQHGIKRAQRVLQVWRGGTSPYSDVYIEDGRLAQRMLRTRVMCSCPCCGNPRRWFGLKTRQEIQADEAFEAQLGTGA